MGKVQEIATRLSDGQIIDLEDITDGSWWAQAIDLTKNAADFYFEVISDNGINCDNLTKFLVDGTNNRNINTNYLLQDIASYNNDYMKCRKYINWCSP